MSLAAVSAHMGSMEELLASLRALSERFADSPSDDAREISLELDALVQSAPAAEYEYRHNLGWDNTWMELDEAHVALVLKRGHTVERRQAIRGGWEPVTEVPA